MEFDAFSCYQQNALKLKIRESTCYGIHIDNESSVIVTCTDFGHIHLYNHSTTLSVTEDDVSDPVCNSSCNFKKKTLYIENPPIFATQLTEFSSGKILFCGGRNNRLQGYMYEVSLLSAEHNSTISPDFEYECGSDEGVIMCIATLPEKHLMYAANDRGNIYCFNVRTGESLMPRAATSAAHSALIHSLTVISSTDASKPGDLIRRSRVCSGVAESLGVSPTSLWASSMAVDSEGNFVYLGGGAELPSSSSSSSSSKSNNAFHRASTGWLASFLLSDYVGDSRGNGGADDDSCLTLIKCVTAPVPIQTLQLQEAELVTGGAQPSVSFWRCHSLEHVASMQTSAQSIFAIASRHTSHEHDDNPKLMAVGGTTPVVDLVSVIGHKEAVLWPM